MVCQFYRFGDAFWFATPRTPPLWQGLFFLVNCLALRRLLASVRSGVVITFRCPGRVRQMDELFTRLDRIASQMDALRWSPDAELNYDMMAGAIWWSDERPNFRQAEDHWCLRPVFRYRTAMILETPEPKWQLFWDRATELFPNWPGFHLSRTTPNPELVAFHNSKSKIAMDSFLEGVDDPELREEMRREMDD